MPRVVDPKRQREYATLRQQGWSRKAAASQASVSYDWAIKFDKGHDNSGDGYLQARREQQLKDPIPFDKLCDEAKRALEDFEFFRRRYMGHVSTPWQVETADLILALKDSPDREYVVENVAPGLGKSTLLVDIAAWLTVRDRSIRGLFISRAVSLASRNTMRLRRYLDRVVPVRAKPEEIDKGLAVDAEATLAGDYGRFKPVTAGDVWKRDEFVVVQMDGSPIEEKEPTWSAFGFDSEWIGNRFNLSFADDLDSTRSTRSVDVVARNQETFDNELEPRLEPGGLMVVCQQRLGPHDFSSHCLSKQIVPDDTDGSGEIVEGEPQYRHIVYKTHYPDLCQGTETHRSDSAPWNGTQDGGCLLDPRRLGWRDVRKAMNNRTRFEVVYQQEDVDPASVLVQKLWVTGGRGSDGIDYPGCWDRDRGACEIPPALLTRETLSVLTADPSPTRFWSVQWWLWDPDTDYRFLMDLAKQAMSSHEFLYKNDGEYSGLLDEWWQRADDLGKPFTHAIIEKNAAQRFMLEMPFYREWGIKRKVHFVSHETMRNKTHPEFGIQMLPPLWEHGKVRLPGKQNDPGRLAAMKLVDEVTRYPEGSTDDCVMAEWFFEHHLPNLWVAHSQTDAKQKRPSWLRGRAA